MNIKKANFYGALASVMLGFSILSNPIIAEASELVITTDVMAKGNDGKDKGKGDEYIDPDNWNTNDGIDKIPDSTPTEHERKFPKKKDEPDDEEEEEIIPVPKTGESLVLYGGTGAVASIVIVAGVSFVQGLRISRKRDKLLKSLELDERDLD